MVKLVERYVPEFHLSTSSRLSRFALSEWCTFFEVAEDVPQLEMFIIYVYDHDRYYSGACYPVNYLGYARCVVYNMYAAAVLTFSGTKLLIVFIRLENVIVLSIMTGFINSLTLCPNLITVDNGSQRQPYDYIHQFDFGE